MKPHLAIERLLRQTSFDAVPFKWIAEPVRETNADGAAILLSLSSEGHLFPRPDRSEGAQASSEETIRRGPLVSPDDLVVNPMWLVGGGIAVSDRAGTVSPDYRVYRLDTARVHPQYLHHLLRSPEYRGQYRLYTRSEATFDRRVSRSTFESMPVILPPVDVQANMAEAIDRETSRIDALRRATEQVIVALGRRQQVLATAALSGEL